MSRGAEVLMKYRLVRRLVLALAVAAVLVSCSNLFQNSVSRKPSGNTLTVTIRGASRGAPLGGRTILPPAVLPSDLLYDLSLTRAGYSTIALTGAAYNALTVSGIAAGDWALTVIGRKSGSAIYETTNAGVVGPVTVTIVNGANSVGPLALDPLRTTTGSVNITVTWPAAAVNAVNAVNVYWGTTPQQLISTGYTATFGASPSLNLNFGGTPQPSGDYYFEADLMISATNTIVASVVELVRVYDNQVSTATIALGAADLSSPPAAPSNCTANFAGLFPYYAWTSNSSVATGYHIYKNGTLLFSASGSAVSYSATLSDDPYAAYSISAYNTFGEFAPVPCTVADTLTVNFIENNYALTFSGPLTVAYGTPISIKPSSVPSDADLFALSSGWSWYVDGVKQPDTGNSFSFNTAGTMPAGQYIISATVPDKGILHSGSVLVTIQAPNIPNEWTVTYSNQYADGGVAPIDGTVYADGATVTVLGNTGNLSRANSVFIGWISSPAGIGEVYGPSKTATFTISSDTTLYPKWAPFDSGDGSSGNPFKLHSAFQLNGVRDYLASCFVQTANIDLSGYANWSPIGTSSTPFTGSYSGSVAGTTISGLSISASSADNVGLFGATNGASISQILLTGATVVGHGGVGALIGTSSSSTIFQCGCEGSVSGSFDGVGGLVGVATGGTISQSFSWASASGTIDVGGFVGKGNSVAIDNCNATGSVQGNGTTGDEYYVAGLVGYASGGSITSSFAIGGAMMVSTPAQGLAGYPGVTCTASYFDSDFNSPTASYGGGTDLTQLTFLTTTSGIWSSSIWRFTGMSAPYPELLWQPSLGW